MHIKDQKQYRAEIFGKQEGSNNENGSLDVTSEEELDAILASLKEPLSKWESDESGSNLHDWMLERSEMMKSCMITSVRTKAGLGFPPQKFYTNDFENTNRRLRHKLKPWARSQAKHLFQNQ